MLKLAEFITKEYNYHMRMKRLTWKLKKEYVESVCDNIEIECQQKLHPFSVLSVCWNCKWNVGSK